MAVDDEADDHVSAEEAMIGSLKLRVKFLESEVLLLTTQLDQAKVEIGAMIEQSNARGEAYTIADQLHQEAEAELADLRRQLQTYGHAINAVILENVEADEGGISCRVCEEYNVTDHAEHAPKCPIFKLEQVLETCGFTAALNPAQVQATAPSGTGLQRWKISGMGGYEAHGDANGEWVKYEDLPK